jgi:hypothetical protein
MLSKRERLGCHELGQKAGLCSNRKVKSPGQGSQEALSGHSHPKSKSNHALAAQLPRKLLLLLVIRAGLEPATHWLKATCSLVSCIRLFIRPSNASPNPFRCLGPIYFPSGL